MIIWCFLNWSPPYFLKQHLSLDLELGGSARLASQQAPRDPPVFTPPLLGLQVHTTTPRFYKMALEKLNSGSIAYVTSILPTKLSPQHLPQIILIFVNK